MTTQSDDYVTRIARRRARPGHEAQYEELARQLLAGMKKAPGFRGGELIPPEEPGGSYQLVSHFDTEANLAAWDEKSSRAEILDRMHEHAEGEPGYRRLTGLEAWFTGPMVPADTKPPRAKMAFVTWLGIWPLASFFIYFLTPVWSKLGFPFLLITAINVALIVTCMTWLVAPRLTALFKPWLTKKPRQKKA